MELEGVSMKYCEIVADKLIAAGWSWEYCSAAPEGGRWIVAAHKNGQRHIVHSDELVSAFLELELTLLQKGHDPVAAEGTFQPERMSKITRL